MVQVSLSKRNQYFGCPSTRSSEKRAALGPGAGGAALGSWLKLQGRT